MIPMIQHNSERSINMVVGSLQSVVGRNAK